MKDIDVGQIRPENPNGLEKYKFTMPTRAQVLVYHYTEYKTPFGKTTEDWLCCTEGWYLRRRQMARNRAVWFFSGQSCRYHQ